MMDALQKDRERLMAKREEIAGRKKALDDEIAGVDRQLSAIAAYYKVLEGKPAKTTQRAPRGSQKQTILDHLKEHPGAKPADIAKALSLKAQGVSNVLSTLKKEGTVKSHEKGYAVA